jgi:hypothetical protein
VSNYRKSWEIVLDGEPFKVSTNGQDMANAERMAARDGFSMLEGGAVAMQQRLAYIGFRRANPGHAFASSFPDFVAVLDDVTDLEAEASAGGEEVDPTPPADSAGSP